MALPDHFDDDEPTHDMEPEPWRRPVRCPRCLGEQTRFVSLNYEMSVYECQACGEQFEVEEEA